MENSKSNSFSFTVSGLDAWASGHNIHIEDSWQIRSRRSISDAVAEANSILDDNSIDSPFDNRTEKSMVREWVAHNNLYRLGIKKRRTGSVDLNYPQRWFEPFCYFILSIVVL